MPQIPMHKRTVIILTDQLGHLTPSRLRSILNPDDLFARLILILPEITGGSEIFASTYHLLYKAYERILEAMSVEDGLRVELTVLLYPTYCNLNAFHLKPESAKVFIFGEPNISILNGLPIQEWVTRTDGPIPLDGNEYAEKEKFNNIRVRDYQVVALGGTFDHLHAGHKIMLSSAVILAKSHVVIGLTDSSMLDSKKHRERLYEYAERERTVLQFMEAFSKGTGLKIDIVRLNDQFGPTITTPDIDLLVVSEETLPGAKEINRIRAEHGMKELEVVAVQFVKLSDRQRISSTLIRNQSSSA